MDVLRRVLKRLRWDDQGGYPGYRGDGKWAFVSVGLPQVDADELNALLEFAGIVPDEIVPLGSCADCKFAIIYERGTPAQERGYRSPCVGCMRPRHDRFVPCENPRAKCKACGEVSRHPVHVEEAGMGPTHLFVKEDKS